MKSKNNELDHEFLYIETKKLLIVMLFAIVSYTSIILLYIKIPTITIPLLSLAYLMGSACILIIIRSTATIYKSNYLKIIKLFYLGIAIETILNNTLAFRENDLASFTKYSDIISKSIFICLIGCVYLFGKSYVDSKKDDFKKLVILIILASSIISTLLVSKCLDIAIIILNLVAIFIAIKSKKYLEPYSLRLDSEINYISCGVYIIYIICILNLVCININKHIFIINVITNGLFYVGFIIICAVIIDKMVNNPHKSIFKQLYNKNMELNELNKKIIIQNRELELSQITIKKKEKLVRSFFRDIPIAFIFINKNTSRVTYANRSFMELIEESNLRSIINKKFNSLFIIDDNSSNIEGEYLIQGKMYIRGKEKNVTIEVFSEVENQEEIIVSFTDITEKVKTYRMKENLKSKVFEEKIKRDFLSNISHDLKTPVNVIYSASQLMEIYIKEGNYEGIEKYNKISKQNCLSLTRFTNNLIDRSKIYSHNLTADLKVHNIVEVIENIVLSLVDYAKNKKIDLIFDTVEEEIYAKIDCDFMERIIINIISNSIKYCFENGQILVTIKDAREEVIVLIEDNGIGMDEEFLITAFSRYSMGKNNEVSVEKGTGIGLFVVKKLMEEQGGRIDITSKVNEGTKTELIFNKVVEF